MVKGSFFLKKGIGIGLGLFLGNAIPISAPAPFSSSSATLKVKNSPSHFLLSWGRNGGDTNSASPFPSTFSPNILVVNPKIVEGEIHHSRIDTSFKKSPRVKITGQHNLIRSGGVVIEGK